MSQTPTEYATNISAFEISEICQIVLYFTIIILILLKSWTSLTSILFYKSHKITTNCKPCVDVKEIKAAGATSSVAKTIVAPVERIKLILQNQNSALQILTGERRKFDGFLDCVKRLPNEQGLLSFWRGNGANLLRGIPSQALNFSFNDFFKHHFYKLIGDGTQSQSTLIAYLSGGCAGACTIFTVYPLKFCQTRISVDMGSGKCPTNSKTHCVEREFHGVSHCLRKVVQIDGIPGLYRGFLLAALGAAVYRAMYFGLFDNFKILYAQNSSDDDYVAEKPPIAMEFLFAQSVTVAAGFLTYPFDTVGRRLMLDSGRKKELKVFTDTWTAFRVMYVSEGIQAFYRGALTNCVRGIGGALVLVFYDEFLHYTKWKDMIAFDDSAD